MSKAPPSKLAKNATTVPEAPPPAPVAPPEDPLRLELMRRFLAQREQQRADLSEFNNAKQEEWLRFFGFSMERELMWAKARPDLFKIDATKEETMRRKRELQQEAALKATGPEFYGRRQRPISPKHEFKSSTAKAKPPSTEAHSSETEADDADGLDGFARTDDPIQGNKPVEGANPAAFLAAMKERIAEADQRALDAPKYEAKNVAYVAEQLTAPYANITWRLDEAQSALLKARVVYRWLCKHMTMALPQAGGGGSDAHAKGHGKTLTFADMPKGNAAAPAVPANSLPAAGAMGKSALSKKEKPNGLLSSVVSGEMSGERMAHGQAMPHHAQTGSFHITSTVAATITTASDPLLISRVVNPRSLAALFGDFMMCVGVDAPDVKGTLKGTVDYRGKPSGYMKWAWNVVTIPAAASTDSKPLQLLIDVPLSMVSVNPRAGISPFLDSANKAAAGGAATASSATSLSNAGGAGKQANRPLSPQSRNTGKEKGPSKEEDTRAQIDSQAMAAWQALQQEKTRNVSAATPKFNITFDLAPHFEPFYFGCDPRHFASLHFPDEPGKYLLLQQSVSKPQWESYPRLTHSFYKYQLELSSHKRRTMIQCRAAPLYIAFTLGDCAHVEVTAAIFKGTISQQNLADINLAANPNALGPGYVYSQRCEKEGKLTFTLMTPDVGVYTVVFGARRVNDDRTATGVSNEMFDIVATYQVQMNFVALNEPVLPHQHLTPATLKLIEPREHKAIVGKQRFVVVPTTPRVLCVAIVNRMFKHSAQPLTSVAVGLNSVIPVLASSTAAQQTPSSASNAGGNGSKSPKRSSGRSSARGQAQLAREAAEAAAALLSTSASPPPPPPPAVVPDNVKITLLELNAAMGTFEGEVDAQQGVAEVWALMGDPRCLSNTLTHTTSKMKGMSGTVAGAAPARKDSRSGSVMGLLPPISTNGGRPSTSASVVSNDRAVATPSIGAAAGSGGGAKQSATNAAAQQALLFEQYQQALATQNAAAVAAVTANYPTSQFLRTLSPEVIAQIPSEDVYDVRNGSNGRIQAVFVPAITDLMVVKRIVPKECMLNEGRGVIQPVMAEENRVLEDLPYIFRLMSGSTDDGRRRTSDADAIVGKVLRPVGNYFEDRQ